MFFSIGVSLFFHRGHFTLKWSPETDKPETEGDLQMEDDRELAPKIRALAEGYGVKIIGSEIVGLTPGKALIDCAAHYLKLENFNCTEQVMEYQLIGME